MHGSAPVVSGGGGIQGLPVARPGRSPELRADARRLLPPPVAEQSWPHFDQGTQRAILQLYRASPEDALARAGLDLGRIDCPALVVWGDRDSYIPAPFADADADALGGDAEVLHLHEAGHWPWLDRPDVVDRIAAFLDA